MTYCNLMHFVRYSPNWKNVNLKKQLVVGKNKYRWRKEVCGKELLKPKNVVKSTKKFEHLVIQQ